MTEKEWLDLGRKNGVIQDIVVKPCSFGDAYNQWFLMKMKAIRGSSLDRIEVTFNKYYRGTGFASMDLSVIHTACISDFLNDLLVRYQPVSLKEFKRIYQVVNNVLRYASNMGLGAVSDVNWDVVKQYVPYRCISSPPVVRFALPDAVVSRLFDCVVHKRIYALKQSACLCLVLNFFMGLRIGELAALKWSDIDFSRRVAYVRRTAVKTYPRDSNGNRLGPLSYLISSEAKTANGVREIPLCDTALSLLRLLRVHHDAMGYQSESLAYDGCPGIVLVRSVDKTLRRLCYLCDVEHFNSHLIRKTFASKMHDCGVSTRVISDIIGHADMETTENIYILGYADNWTPVLDRMNTAFKFGLEGSEV